MPRKKSSPDPIPAGNTLEQRVDVLTAAVDKLEREIRVIREVIDEERQQMEWTTRNRERPSALPPIVHITSLPLDPLAEEFGERINRIKPEALHHESTKEVEENGQEDQFVSLF